MFSALSVQFQGNHKPNPLSRRNRRKARQASQPKGSVYGTGPNNTKWMQLPDFILEARLKEARDHVYNGNVDSWNPHKFDPRVTDLIHRWKELGMIDTRESRLFTKKLPDHRDLHPDQYWTAPK